MTKLKVLLMVAFIVSGCAAGPQPLDPQTLLQRGIRHYKAGNYDAAISEIKKSIDIYPEKHAYTHLGIAYYKKGAYDAAIEQFKKQIKLTPDNPNNPNNYHSIGGSYQKKKQYEDAVVYFQKAIAEGTANPQGAFRALANCYNNLNQYNDAIKAGTRAIELDFSNDGGHFELAYAFFKTRQHKNAFKAYKKAIELDPKDPKYYSRWGALLGNSGDYAGAAEQYKKAVSLLPNNIKYLSRLSSAYFKQGRYDDALDAVNKIIGPSTSSAIGYRSLIQRHRGEKDESLKDAKQAYSLASSDKWAQLALGSSYLDQGRYDEAVKLLSQVRESTSARFLEATAYARKGDFKRAVDIYAAIPEEKLSPKNVPLWSDRTALLDTLKPLIASRMESAGRLKTRGRYKEALKELGNALKIADNKTSKKICGSIYRIISMDPRLSELPEEARKYALRGDVMTEEGKVEDAVKEYRQAVQSAPYIAKLYFNTAMIYGELKRHPQAIRNMKTYLLLAPEAPNVRAAKDQIYKWEFKMEKGK